MNKKMDVVDLIMSFEQEKLSDQKILELFAELIRTKQCYSLQGSYGRMSDSLINNGYISSDGEILKEV